MYPMLWEASGVTLEQLVHQLLNQQDNERRVLRQLMSHGLLWFPLACAAGLARMAGTAAPKSVSRLGRGSELAKLDGCGGARLKDGELLEQLRGRQLSGSGFL